MADLEGAYPHPKGDVAEKDRARALKRRRRLKPGQLELIYGKAGKRLKVQLYDAEGKMSGDAYRQLTRLLYSPSEGYLGKDPWIAYHPRLFAVLYFIGQHFDKPVEVISAFRAPKTARAKASSNHARGRAVDIRIKDVPRRRLLSYVDRSFQGVGVGWYPNSTFVHVDVRKTSYFWTDFSGPGQRQRMRKRKPAKRARWGSDPVEKTVHLSPEDLYKDRSRRKRRRRGRRRTRKRRGR